MSAVRYQKDRDSERDDDAGTHELRRAAPQHAEKKEYRSNHESVEKSESRAWRMKRVSHHHGELETVLDVLRGRVRMRWGDHLELSGEAQAGDFIYVPPYVPIRRSTPIRMRFAKQSWFESGKTRLW